MLFKTSLGIGAQPAGAKTFTKTQFDSLGRQIRQYVGYDLNETFWTQAITVDGDTLFEQRETTYDAAGNSLVEVLRERNHDATGTGALNGPGGPEPKARTSYVAHWADPLGRNIATADYGTNGGTAPTRPDTVPARSDTVLVTTTEYNGRGEAWKAIDPAGTETREETDDAGRLVKRIENYKAAPSGSDQSNTTEFTYAADGGYATITAKNATTGDQVTRYAYGTTLADSGVARSDLLRAEIYPDSDDVASPLGNGPDGVYDRFEMKYNRQGEVIERKDPASTIHALDYDKLGRPVHDRVTALGPQVNGAVRRMSRAYEVRGMLLEVTSWDNAAVGSGAIVNQVRLAYNTFGQPVIEYQEHGGAVNTATSRKVQYGTAGGSGNTVRPTSITYPNGRVVVWDYSTTGSTPDALSRVARIFVDNVHVASYVYAGLGRIVQVDHPQPFIRYDLATGSGTDPYAGLDRFGRVIDCRWRDYGSGTPIDIERVQYGYDRASNRSYRENTVDTTTSKAELYGYDGLYRLKTFERGTLNAGKTALTTKTFGQQWNLDATGNWSGFNEDTNGDGTWELGQTRVSNEVNEIASFTNSPGPTWFAPSYDAAGNMTIAPVPSLPGPLNFRSQEFDAWNRLTKAVTATAILGEFAYDGLDRRITKKTFSGATPLNTRHYYYSQDWQVLEERLDAGTAADRQFVWGIRYIDNLLLRDSDTNADGTLDERLYAVQDDNWNLTAVADPAGDIQERYRYDAYGLPSVLTPAFASRSSSLFDWETLYASYRWDAETKMYQVRNRWLDSRVGVWVTRDQLNRSVSMSVFAYVDLRPIGATDPFGLAPCFRLKATAKSYIAPIGKNVGFDEYNALQMNAIEAAAITDLMFSEDVSNDAKDKRYRLYSSRTFVFCCKDGRLIGLEGLRLDTDLGTEGPLRPLNGKSFGVAVSKQGVGCARAFWSFRARPAIGAEPFFQQVAPRSSLWIWHSVYGTICCCGNTPYYDFRIVGSRFPSHKLFVGIGDLNASNIDTRLEGFLAQGAFESLWISHPADSSLVR